MIKIEKNEEMKKLLNLLGAKEIGFVHSHERNDYISCSCGCQTKVTEKAYYRENNRSHLMCPKCGTKFIYEDLAFEDDNMPMHYSYKITQDDDNFMVMLLYVQGVYSNSGIVKYKEEEIDFFRIVYDKKNDFFFVATNEDYEEEIEEELVYNDTHIENKTGDEIARFCSTNDLSNYCGFAADNCFTSHEGQKHSGLYEIAEQISKRTDWKSTCESDFESLDSLLSAMFIEINTKWWEDLTEKVNNQYGYISFIKLARDLGRSTLEWLSLKSEGVDMRATTIEEAFGMSLEELTNLQSIYDYIERKLIKNIIEDAKLSELELRLLNTIQYENWSKLINLADKFEVRLGNYIIHVARGIQRGCTFRNICEVDENVFDKNYFPIDFNLPFTPQILAKYNAVVSEKLTSSQYDAVAKKPTLDTLYKELIQN